MLPSHRLLARAFHRAPPVISQSSSSKGNHSTPPPSAHHTSLSSSLHLRHTPSLSPQSRSIGTTATGKWEGRKAQDHTARETDSHNVQQDAVREGKAERAKSGGGKSEEEGVSRGASEKAGESTKKAKEEFPEAPDTIGMQDERGGKD